MTSQPLRVNVVHANEDDLAAICALALQVDSLHAEAWPQIFGIAEYLCLDPDFWRKYLTQPCTTILLAKLHSRAVGMAAAQIVPESKSPLNPMKYCRVGSVCVDHAERGKGIGHQLMGEVERWAFVQGAMDVRLDVWLFNPRAVDLYRELGYTIRGFFMGKLLAPGI